MGIAGTALGTTIAEYIGLAFICLVVVLKPGLKTKPTFRQAFHARFKPYLKSVKLGINSCLEDFIWNFGNIILIALLNTISDLAAGIWTIMLSIEMLGAYVQWAIGRGCMTLTGEATGARDQELFRKVIGTRELWSALVSAFILIMAIRYPTQIVGIFTKNQEVIDCSYLYLVLVGVNLFAKGTNLVVGNGIRGFGDTRWMFITQIIGTFVIVGVAYLCVLVFGLGLTGVFVALLTDEGSRAIINTIHFLRLNVADKGTVAAESAAG